MPMFTRNDAAAIRKMVIGLEGRVRVEVGIRTDANGTPTPDSIFWTEDAELHDMSALHDVHSRYGFDVRDGSSLDLYLYHAEDGLVANYDATKTHGQWHIIDQRSGRRVA